MDLHLSISNGIASSKIYDKRDDFDFDIVNFPFLDGDVPRSTSYGVYISHLIRFARVSIGTGIYGDLVYKFKTIVGRADVSDLFRKIITCYKRIRHHKIPVPTDLDAKVFSSNIQFRNQFILSAIKFGESLSKFMIPIALLEKFGS